MKLFGVRRCIFDNEGEVFRADITEYVNIEHIVSIEACVHKGFRYVLRLSNGRSFYIHDSEYQSLIDLIEANEKEKK